MAKIKKVYGPYKNSRNRDIVVILYENGKYRTTNYARFLYEKHLGRELDPETETVDHIDRNKKNNDINNLQLIPRKEHSSYDTKRVKRIKCFCSICGKKFYRKPKTLKDGHRRKYRGLFCSKSCVGTYTVRLRKNLLKKMLPEQGKVEPKYYRKSKKK